MSSHCGMGVPHSQLARATRLQTFLHSPHLYSFHGVLDMFIGTPVTVLAETAGS